MNNGRHMLVSQDVTMGSLGVVVVLCIDQSFYRNTLYLVRETPPDLPTLIHVLIMSYGHMILYPSYTEQWLECTCVVTTGSKRQTKNKNLSLPPTSRILQSLYYPSFCEHTIWSGNVSPSQLFQTKCMRQKKKNKNAAVSLRTTWKSSRCTTTSMITARNHTGWESMNMLTWWGQNL